VDPAAWRADDAGAVSRSTRDLFQRALASAKAQQGLPPTTLVLSGHAASLAPY